MNLADKMQLLRGLEGNLRGLKRPLTKSEVARLVQEEHSDKISIAYLSQIESGKRPHMSETTRDLLARFYKVHPGFFVSDPLDFDSNVTSVSMDEHRLDSWMFSGAHQFSLCDPELASALRDLANHEDSRSIILLMSELVRNPELVDRLRRTATRQSSDSAPKHREVPPEENFEKETL